MSQKNNKSMSKNVVALFGEVLVDVFPDRSVLGGAPYNVARHLQAFDQHPVLVTRTGDDDMGKRLLADMSGLGIDEIGVQCDYHYPTGQVIVRLSNGTHEFNILPDQAYDHIHSGMTHVVTMSKRPAIAYYGTLAQRSLESRLALDTFLSDAKSPRFLDMNLRHPWYDKHVIRRSLLRADIVKLNEEELDVIAKTFNLIGVDERERGEYLMQKFDLDCLLVTCGEDGAWAVFKDEGYVRVASEQPQGGVIDTVGAGDGFSAVCILGFLHHWSPEIMLQRASAFAAAVCGIRGAAPDTANFYHQFIREW